MCGRFAQTGSSRRKALTLAQQMQDEIAFRAAVRADSWNVAPSTFSLAVRGGPQGRSVTWLSWGLEGGGSDGPKPINARVETAASKPTFRNAWKTRRCVIPVDGWYEWKVEQGRKQPFYFHRRDDVPIIFAALWSGETFCLLTAPADGHLVEVHHRRPLSLRDDEALRWIGDGPLSPDLAISAAVPACEIVFHPVSHRVSTARNDGPDLIEAVVPEFGDEFLPGF